MGSEDVFLALGNLQPFGQMEPVASSPLLFMLVVVPAVAAV